MSKHFPLKAIGRARSPVTKMRAGGFRDVTCEVYLNPELVPATAGLEGFSHVIVLFWMDRADAPRLKVVPQGKAEAPEVGVLATRESSRPNPIGVTVCELIRCDGERLTIRGLDVVDGTPIVDVKPYLPQTDRVENVRFPEWINRLDF
ncbi:MAG TPA: tRNA (N6-threonylcarbamoyladenosine(37)-N6)-methyltransferase TrmO [Myxococcota bacterium]|jgi:tRNA-Thr(GGU) m(6)t(6)A37 methyltransferase TsaA|nr:tRNA (N6-threonylcarbamoyladenosine(37)-N6)-methyltransferase TrmO [Myxococcota bacterium]